MYNRNKDDRSFSYNTEVSMTVPNQSYTIQELFERHKRNLPLPVEDIMPYFDNLDLDADYLNPLPGEEFVEYYNRLSDIEKSKLLDNLSKEIREDPDKNEEESSEKTPPSD